VDCTLDLGERKIALFFTCVYIRVTPFIPLGRVATLQAVELDGVLRLRKQSFLQVKHHLVW